MFRRIGMLAVGLVLVITLIPFSANGTDHLIEKREITEPEGAAKIRVVEAYGKLPLHFETNQGQVDERVRFLSRGTGYNLFLTSTGAVLTLVKRENNEDNDKRSERHNRKRWEASALQTGTLRMRWEGANEDSKVEGVEGLEGKSHYFIGNDPKKWRSNISLYRKVRYRDLYPGIDLIYYGNQRQLEYDLVVMPEADPGAIRLGIEGAEEVRVNEGGDLILRISGGEVIQHKPLIYQETEGKREIIRGGYVVENLGEKEKEKGKVRISLKIDHFDREKPLVIDPYLVYSTYLGGWSGDRAYAIEVDNSGSAYITGMTSSPDFPTINPTQGLNGFADAFVTKLDPSGTALVYSTYLGGANSQVTHDAGKGIAVDSSGSAYITGGTSSTDFPTLNPIQAVYGGGLSDGFVTKLDPSGSALVYSTYLGGSGNDVGNRIVVDSSGNAYITGSTESTNFSTFNPFQPSNGGDSDAFVTKLSSSGALVYSTYLGGSDWDGGLAIAVDDSGSAYVTGETYSYNFPTKDPIQASLGGLYADAFVTKLNPSGTALVYSTFLGGRVPEGGAFEYDIDYGNGIAVDDSGSAYVVGSTWCLDFPTVNPIQASNAGIRDLFVAKLNPTGTALIYSTYLGGSDNDEGTGIAVDGTGSAHITGYTKSTDFPTLNATQETYGGGDWDAFVAKLNPSGSALVYSTYLGGSGTEYGYGIAVDSSGAAYIAGATSSTDFPTLDPIQGSYAGGVDAFVTKIDSGTPTLSVTPSDGLSSSGIQGGPFSPSSKDYTLQNTGATSINWTASKGQTWVTLSSAGGTLAAGAITTVTVSINSGANSLTPGTYSDTVSFTNTTDGKGSTTKPVSLTVIPPGALSVTPADGLTSSGNPGGPFTPSSKVYTLRNTGGSSIDWTASKLQTWTTLPSIHGTLGAGSSVTVTVSINSGANSLTPGTYSDTVSFTNTTNGNGNTTRPVSLRVIGPGTLSVTPADGLTSSGNPGGPFTPSSKVYTLQNIGNSSIDWTASNGQSWVTLSSTSGTLAAGASTTVTVSINSGANSLTPGSYSDTVSFTNTTNGNGNTTRPASLTVNAPPGGLLPYDNFSGIYIDKAKWLEGESVLEIDTGNQKLRSEMASISPIGITIYPHVDVNRLNFVAPTSVNSFQADVTILESSIANIASATARLEGVFYNDGTSGAGIIGDVFAMVAIGKETNGGLVGEVIIGKLTNAEGTTWKVLWYQTFSVSVVIGIPYTLYLAYDSTANQFTFRVGGEEKIVGLGDIPVRIAEAKAPSRGLTTVVYVENATSSGYVSATFDNVYKNGTRYDDFSTTTIDPARWTNYEFVREISGEKLRSKVRSSSASSSLINEFRFVNPRYINGIQTKFTLVKYENLSSGTAWADAIVEGCFYHDGTPGGGLTGDVIAKVSIGGPGKSPIAFWLVYRFDDETGWNFTDLGYGQFATPISLGTTYTLSLGWDGRQITFKLNDEVATYMPVGTIDPPNRHWKGISTLVYQPNGNEAIIEALFDDVMVSAASCPEISVNPQLIDFGIVSPGGSTPDQTVTIKNAGSMNLTLGTIGTPSAPFSLTGGTCTSNQAVTPQGSCSLTIRFAPTAPGVFTSNFSIPSDDPVDPSVTVNLAGKASSTRQYRLKVIASSSKNGVGVIERDDGLISCGDGGACMYNYDEGTTVILEAIPNEGSVFAKWTPTSLGCYTEPTCAVIMSKSITVKAKFQGPNKLKVKVVSKKGGSGTVTSNIPGLGGNPVECPAILCQNYYTLSDTVTLTATPQGTSTFAGWKPASLGCGAETICSVPMDRTRNIQAVFGPEAP